MTFTWSCTVVGFGLQGTTLLSYTNLQYVAIA